MASEAAVCLSSCGVSPSKPAVTAAGLNTSLRKFRFRSTPPRAPVNMRSFGPLPALRTSSSSTRNLGIGTDLRWCRCRTHPGPHGGDRNGQRRPGCAEVDLADGARLSARPIGRLRRSVGTRSHPVATSRLHLDVHVAQESALEVVDAVESAGGRRLDERFAPSWWVIADAEGNRLCVCTPHEAPPLP